MTAAKRRSRSGFWALTLGSIGVVYGDIGTSPLYALRESVLAAVGPGNPASEPVVLGILSLIIWALLLVVTAKYVLILLRADNNGEGGTLALMALASRALGGSSGIVILLGIISGALFYGDAIITPALSVLSAVEGLKIVTPAFDAYVVPITVVILVGLFSVQSRGTAKVAAFFGPITLVWFAAIAVAGLWHIGQNLTVLLAFNPYYGVNFLLHHGIIGFYTLGAVFLVVTGSEALYADLGHFGRGPIRFAWLVVVLPALLINYLGQGALVLADPKAIENPFFLLYPDWALLPMVVLATAATVIASQAVITGAYSLTQQAIQLGLLPRLEIRHTSESLFGQIYMPRVNTLLLIGVLLLVALFRSSSALASAYGIAVTGTMVVTAMMAIIVIRRVWRWPLIGALALMLPFLFIDLTFPGRQPAQGRRGRLDAAGARRRGDGGDVHVAARQPAAVRKNPPAGNAARIPGGQPGKEAAGSRAGHGGVPHQRSGERADRAVAQPQALQGAAREERHPHHRDRRHAAGRSGRAGAHRAGGARPSRGWCCGSASWKRRTCRRRWRSRASSAGSSTSCRRRSSCRGARSSRPPIPACRAGRTGCSSGSPASPTTPPTISRSRPGGWWRSARR